MTRMEPPSSEGYARAFGEWKIWFEWGSARFDAPEKASHRHGSSAEGPTPRNRSPPSA